MVALTKYVAKLMAPRVDGITPKLVAFAATPILATEPPALTVVTAAILDKLNANSLSVSSLSRSCPQIEKHHMILLKHEVILRII